MKKAFCQAQNPKCLLPGAGSGKTLGTRKGKKSLGGRLQIKTPSMKAVYQNGLLQLRDCTHSHPFKVKRSWFSKKLCWRTSFCVHPRTWGCAAGACAVFGVEHACKEKNLQLQGWVRTVFLCNAMMRNIIWRGVTSFLFLTNDKWAWFKNVGPPKKNCETNYWEIEKILDLIKQSWQCLQNKIPCSRPHSF